jgi:benzylsuccinate CoA-transferase BbsE subunit
MKRTHNPGTEKDLLHGLTVIDLADGGAAFCGKLLGDLGARVIKIEPPRGAAGRSKPPFVQSTNGDRKSLSYIYFNADKSAVSLSLSHPDGIRIFHRLLKKADIVVESFTPGYLDQLGIGYDTIIAEYPELIMASISGFGQSGPNKSHVSCDLIAAATGGLAYITGSSRTPPRAPVGEQSYYAASLYAAIGILLALQGRRISGRGSHIDISLQEAALGILDHVMPRYFHESEVATRRGGRHWDNLFAVLPCKDGYIHLTPLLNWDTLVEWLDSEDMARDLMAPKWRDESYRVTRVDHIIEVMTGWTRLHTVQELFERGQLMGFPWAPVYSLDGVVSNPQLEDREFWTRIAGEDPTSAIRFPGMPYKFNSTRDRTCNEAPQIGEHNSRIFEEMAGLSVEQQRTLKAKGVI